MKYINFKRYKFSTIVKNLSIPTYNFLKSFRFLDFRRYNFTKALKYTNIKKLNLSKFYKYFDFKSYNFYRLKKFNFLNNNFWTIHLPVSIIFFSFLYLLIPTFFNYEKSRIQNLLCQNNNIECNIRGEIIYRFYPTPRLKINDLIINSFSEKKKTLITVDNASIKLSFKNLLAKEKHEFKKIELKNFETNLNLKKYKEFKSFFKKKINLIPIVFTDGKIVFFDDNDYVATINDANLKMKLFTDFFDIKLNGKFLNDNLNVSITNKKADDEFDAEFIFKMSDLNLFTKINFSNFTNDKKPLGGNLLIKKDKNKITSIFEYKDKVFSINKSNIRNTFFDGKLEGKIDFFPYFNFDLDLSLNSLNFTKLYNYFLSLNEDNQKKLFKINNKINGKLNLSSNKIYSSYNLVKSFESRMNFNNGNVLINQFLINLGKLGAADLIGEIYNDKKFSYLKFESNVFVDNQKKFLSKFGIFNKEKFPTNFFISGNLDLNNLKASFYEISDDKKLSNEDINFVEREFNDFMFEDGYTTLFRFPIFKEFIKSISQEIN